MTDPLLEQSDGQTPLDPADAVGLKPTWVRTRADLNEVEQANIVDALRRTRPPTLDELLDDLWLRRFHGRLLGDVWKWAGQYRTTEKNIGIDPTNIAVEVRKLVADTRVRADHDDPTTVAARFHHRLVAIHPFRNGNGRHGRAVADYLIAALDAPSLTWGRRTHDLTATRQAYLDALRSADAGDLDPLAEFIRS